LPPKVSALAGTPAAPVISVPFATESAPVGAPLRFFSRGVLSGSFGNGGGGGGGGGASGALLELHMKISDKNYRMES
jgi:hypothetical protein